MESPKARSEVETPCWKKKQAEGGFFTNFKDHFDEFVNTSMDQHKICLKKTMKEMGDYVKLKKDIALFKSSKVGNKSKSGVKEMDNSPPAQAAASN